MLTQEALCSLAYLSTSLFQPSRTYDIIHTSAFSLRNEFQMPYQRISTVKMSLRSSKVQCLTVKQSLQLKVAEDYKTID